MLRVVCPHDEARAYRLLAQIIAQNPFLDFCHDRLPEIFHDGTVYPRVHQTKGVTRCGHTVKVGKGFKISLNDFNHGVQAELPAHCIHQFFFPSYKY